jgi:hypothetical protein
MDKLIVRNEDERIYTAQLQHLFAYFQTTATAAMPNGIHSNVGLGGSNLFLQSMNKTPHSNINGKRNPNGVKNGSSRQSENECGPQYFSSSDEANSGYEMLYV